MEATDTAVRLARAVAGVLGLVGLVGTLVVSNDVAGFTATNFFSYFTVESNVLAAVVLLGLAAVPTAAEPTEGLRAATTVYTVVTGLVYNALLRGVDVGIATTTFGDVCNELLHVVVPLAVALDWLLVAPLRVIGRQRALLILLFPLSYLGYSLARGQLTDWYPYPFLNPGRDGAAHVVFYAVAIALLTAVLAWGVEHVGRLGARRVHGVVAAPRVGADDD